MIVMYLFYKWVLCHVNVLVYLLKQLLGDVSKLYHILSENHFQMKKLNEKNEKILRVLFSFIMYETGLVIINDNRTLFFFSFIFFSIFSLEIIVGWNVT